ncbi:unnamed protein product [Symbiodinium pilosum]|uniref:PPPDE domain-containing protein n=1 Tax=Symbiodinium pilosum TaxID=2952 RepID=A0A812TRZ3_SYMPI|nr:unnamed protein product [Symbiodinium pilosum]
METCCVAHVGHIQTIPEMSVDQSERSDEGLIADEMLMWPLQPVSCEDHLPPVHGQLSRRSQKPAMHAGNAWNLLPSVGTWLLPLPCKLATPGRACATASPSVCCKLQERPAALAAPLLMAKAEMRRGEYTPWAKCEIRLHHDRLIILEEGEESAPKVAVEQWLHEPLVVDDVDGRALLLSSASSAEVRCRHPTDASHVAGAARSAADRLTAQVRDRKWAFVHLNIYDLFNWQMGIFNRVAWLVGAGGAYHAGLEVYGVEYAFGGTETGIGESGITACTPRSCHKHSFSESLCLGVTTISAEEVDDLIAELVPDWSTQDYEMLGPNCITFCRYLSRRLGVAEVPDWVDCMARIIKVESPVAVRRLAG